MSQILEELWLCEKCHKPRWLIIQRVDGSVRIVKSQCDCQAKVRDARDAAIRAKSNDVWKIVDNEKGHHLNPNRIRAAKRFIIQG